jgi:hypothetical protein
MQISKMIPKKSELPDLRLLSPAEKAELIRTAPQIWNAAKKVFDRLHPNARGVRTNRQQFFIAYHNGNAQDGLRSPYEEHPAFDLSAHIHVLQVPACANVTGVKIGGKTNGHYKTYASRNLEYLLALRKRLHQPAA